MSKLPLLLGHRGTRARGCRENTIRAFETALKHGCDGFEFDVRLTGDECAVVCHNPTSRGRRLKKTDAARLRHLPLLEEVLAFFAGRAFLNIEIKVPGLENQVLTALREYPPQAGCVVSSFLPEVITALRVRSEAVPLGFIFEKKLPRWQDMPIEYVIPRHRLVTAELIGEVHDHRKHIMTWTVNNPASMQRLADWGVDGIISDKTELLIKTLRPRDGK